MMRRNDRITLSEIHLMSPDAIVISPGPCSPNEAGIVLSLINEYQKQIPIFGVCLGHQAIAQAFMAEVIRAPKPMHGLVTKIIHNSTSGIFEAIPTEFNAVRYHSLIVNPTSITNQISVTATDEDGIIMGISHKEYCIHGVQFHPESICSEYGEKIVRNFINLAKTHLNI